MEAAWWQRLLKILEKKLPPLDKLGLLVQRTPPEARDRTASALQETGIEVSSSEDFLSLALRTEEAGTQRLALARRLCETAVAQGRAAEAKSYEKWLERGSMQGMRPLFRALKKAETVLVRPFGEAPADAKPFLRLKQSAKMLCR